MTAIAASAQTSTNKPGFEINGLFNAGYQANSYKGVNVKGIDQNGSGTTQINFRGLEDLGGGMSAYFRVENDLSIMNNAANTGIIPAYSASTAAALTPGGNSTVQKTTYGVAGTFANSEILVGLRSPVGDVAFGQIHNAGLTMIQGTVSPLAGTAFGGGYGTIIGTDPTMTTTRWANSFRYITPTMNGVTAQYIKAFKQDSASVPVSATSGVAITTTSLGVGLNNQVGADELGIKYSNGPLNVAYVASKTSFASFCAAPSSTHYLTNTDATVNPCYSTGALTTGSAISTAQDNKQNSLAANYNLGNGFLVAGAMQKTTLGNVGSTTGNQSDRSAQMFTVQYTSGANTVFATTGSVKENSSINNRNGQKSTFTGIGYNYALSKTTALVARYESLDDQAKVLDLTATTAYSSLQSPDSSTKRTRSMLGLHMAF